MYHKWQSYNVWFLRCQAWRTEFFVILNDFLPFHPPNNLKNQNFEKMKKTPWDILISHMCTINDNHKMYGFSDMEREGQNLLSFWTVFCPFTPPTTQKIKILKKWKKYLEILSFYTGVPLMAIIWCDVWFLRYETWWTNLLSFWITFCPFTLLTTQKITILKKGKKLLEILFYKCVP